ncbi:MAG: GHMP kinase, partial [Thermoprotei archaeon]
LDEINNYLSRIDKVSAKRIIFTLKMQECTEIALKIIYNRKLSSEELGKIDAEEHDDKIVLIGKVMNKQHELLRDYYDVSLPEIEMIRSSMLKAGALGVKISGAGMGGSLIALVRDKDSSKRVIDAALKSGAANGWYVEISEGAKIINP